MRGPGWWLCTAIGVAGGVLASFFTIWEAALLIGWDVAVAVLLGWIWLALWGLSAGETRKKPAGKTRASISPSSSCSPPGWPSWPQWACC